MKKLKRILQLTLIIAMSAIFMAGCAPAPDLWETAPEAGTEFAAFTAKDLDGNEVTESVFSQAKLTMINVWGTFCGPCLEEMPDLGELSKEYADAGLQIIGIVSDATESGTNVEEAKEIIAQTGADYLHILPSEDLIESWLKDLAFVPATVFVDQNGNIVGELVAGSRDKADWETIIDERMASAN